MIDESSLYLSPTNSPTCEEMEYSSKRGSLVVCKMSGSSVESVTLSPSLKNSKKGCFEYFKNNLKRQASW